MKIITALPRKGQVNGTAYVVIEPDDVGRRVRLDKLSDTVCSWCQKHGVAQKTVAEIVNITTTPPALVPAHEVSDGSVPPPHDETTHHHVE